MRMRHRRGRRGNSGRESRRTGETRVPRTRRCHLRWSRLTGERKQTVRRSLGGLLCSPRCWCGHNRLPLVGGGRKLSGSKRGSARRRTKSRLKGALLSKRRCRRACHCRRLRRRILNQEHPLNCLGNTPWRGYCRGITEPPGRGPLGSRNNTGALRKAILARRMK